MLKKLIKPYYNSYKLITNKHPYRAYNKKYECIFIHIPKTAGTSILKLLNNNKIPRYHGFWFEYQKRSPHCFNDYYKFSFVRNPWDRTVSTFFYLRKLIENSNTAFIPKNLAKYETFDDFVNLFLNKDTIWSHKLFIPQWFFILDQDDILKVDFLGKIESIEEDFDIIKSNFKNYPIGNLKKINSSHRKLYKDYYTNETKTKIAELYSKDIKFFDYEF